MATSVNFGTQQYFGFDPRTIPGCSMWLDAADSNSLTLSGSKVSQWRDKSGNGRNFSQATGALQPTYNATGLQSLPTLQFSSNYMSNAGFALYGSSNSGLASFVVFSASVINQQSQLVHQFSPTDTSYTEIAFSVATGNLNNGSYNLTNFGSVGLHRGFGSVTSTASNLLTANTPVLFSAVAASSGTTPTSVTLVTNGTQQTSSNYGVGGAGNPPAGFYAPGTYPSAVTSEVGIGGRPIVGSSNFLAGSISEIVLFSNALSATQRQQVEGYLMWKWGLRTNLPTGHPFKSAPPLMRAFQPLDVTLPSLWLDAADARTLTLSGSNVTAWTDKTRGTAITIGGSGGLTSTSNDVTTSPARTSYFTVPVDIQRSVTPNLSAFIVYAWLGQSSGTDQVFWGNDNPNNQNRAQFFTFPVFPTINFAYLLAGSVYLINTSVLNTSATQLYTAIEQVGVTNGTAVYVNGALGPAGTGTASSNTSFAGNEILYFGGGETASIYPSYTQFREIVFYSSALTASEQQQVEGYLAHKWGLRGSLPATHPFRTLFPTTPLFVPTQVSGINAWFDGADPLATGSQPAVNSSLSVWYDKSGNGRNASGGVSPTFVSGGVSFNGTSQYYTMSIPYSSNYSIFLVATNTTAVQCYFFSRDSLGGGREPTFIQGYIGAGIGLEWFEGADRATIATTPASPFLASVDHIQGTSIVGWYYGTQAFNISQTRAYAANAWDRLGTATNTVGFYGGTLKELLFFSNVVTTSQRQAIEGYLAWKWGLQTNLPSTHPYAKFRP